MSERLAGEFEWTFGSPQSEKRTRDVEANMRDVARIYPHLAEVVGRFVAKHGFSADEAFEFGLDVILDGLERLRNALIKPILR